MSGSGRRGEAQETQRPSLKFSTPRSVPPVPGQGGGIDSTADTPIVSDTEVSSPYGEDDHNSPKVQLQIDTDREVDNKDTNLNPPTAGLETGGLGRKFFDEETFASLDYFNPLNPLAPSPDDADNEVQRHFQRAEEMLSRAPGTEDILGPIEEGPVIDYGRFLAEEPSLTPTLNPTLPPSYGTPHHISNDALTSMYAYSNAELSASNPALLGQFSRNTHVPESRYLQSALRPRPTRAPETSQGMGLAQQQASYYSAHPPHQPDARNVREDRPLAGSNVDMAGFSHPHLQAISNQQLVSKRRSVSDASIFLPHEHQNRNRMPHTFTNTPTTRHQRRSGFETGYLTEAMNPGYEEQAHAYTYDFSDHNANDGTPVFNIQYPQTQLIGHEEYPPRRLQLGEQEHHNSAHAQQNTTDAVGQDVLYGGTTEILPSQYQPADNTQARDAELLPQQQSSEVETIFDSFDEATKWRHRQQLRLKNDDPTIPRTTAERKQIVSRMVAAINDTDEAMASTYVKYFTDQKYSPAHIESTCWVTLQACIDRHQWGPLQSEDERAPFKAKVAEYNTCAERLEVVIRAFRTQKSICKQLMEPYHLYQFIDDPLAKIKRTENNKALNDRKAEQIAAGKAIRGDGGNTRTRGKKRPLEVEDDVDVLAGLTSASQEPRMASATISSARSTPAAPAAPPSRKRKVGSDPLGVDSTLQSDQSGLSTKRARTGPTSLAEASRPGQHQPLQTYQPHSSGNFTDQSYTAAFGDYQPLGQPTTSGYGNPSTGGVYGTPYFTQRPNVQRRPGQAFPKIEGYHTPSVGFEHSSPYGESSIVGHEAVQSQQFERTSSHNSAINNPAISSGLGHPPAYATGNSNPLPRGSTRGQQKRQAETEDEGSDFEILQPKRKRRRDT